MYPAGIGNGRFEWYDHPMSGLTGNPAIPFRLRDIEGRFHTLAEYRGGWLLMVFHRHLG